MRQFLLLFIAFLLMAFIVTSIFADPISTKTLDPSQPMDIYLSPQVTTTLLLPEVPGFTGGLGLVSQASNATSGIVQMDHPDGSRLIVLHPLSDQAATTMTVLMGGVLYVFNLRTGSLPDVAVTLVKNPTQPSNPPLAVK